MANHIPAAKKLAVDKALQYAETRTINPKEFMELVELLYKYYIQTK